MVARGDLGVEMPLEQLPGIQKAAIAMTNARGGLVIVATEMLESMVGSPRPTRAEVSDVANAIYDGADAVMLSGETASGKYPVEAVRTMARVVVEAEKRATFRSQAFERTDDVSTGVAIAAVNAAERLHSAAIVAYTESGTTARLISELRPKVPLLALTPHPAVIRRLCLTWGVRGHLAPRLATTEAMVSHVRRLLVAQGVAKAGQTVVVVAGTPLGQAGSTNLLTIHRI